MWRTFIQTLAPSEQWCPRCCVYGHHAGVCPMPPGEAAHDGCAHGNDVCVVSQ